MSVVQVAEALVVCEGSRICLIDRKAEHDHTDDQDQDVRYSIRWSQYGSNIRKFSGNSGITGVWCGPCSDPFI